MNGQPLVECFGEGLRVDAVDEIVEGVIARHNKPVALIAHVEANGFALALAEGSATFHWSL